MSFAVGLMKSLTKGIDERSARRKKIIDEQMLLAKTKGVSARNKMKATAQSYKDMITQIKGNVNGQLSDSYLLALASGKGGADLKTVHGLVTSRAANGKTQRYTAEDLNAMINLNSYALPKGMDLNKGLEQLAGLQQKREETDTSRPSDSKFGKNLLLAGFQIDPQQNAETYLKKAHYDGLPVNELIQGIGFSGKGKIEGMGVVQTGKGLSALAGDTTLSQFNSVKRNYHNSLDGFFLDAGLKTLNIDNTGSSIMTFSDDTSAKAKAEIKSNINNTSGNIAKVHLDLIRTGKSDIEADSILSQIIIDSNNDVTILNKNLQALIENEELSVSLIGYNPSLTEGEEEQLGFKEGEVGESDLNKGQANVETVTNSEIIIPVTKPEMKSQVIEVARELDVNLSTLSVETTKKINNEISKINSDKIPAVKLDLIKMFIQQDDSTPKALKVDTESTSKPEVFTKTPKLTEDEKLTADMQQNIYAGLEQDNAMANLYLGADSPTLGEINDTIPKLPNVGGSFSGYLLEQIKEGIFGQDEKTGERNAKVLADDSKYVKMRVKGFPSSFRVKREDLDLISSSLIENGTVDLFELSDTSKDFGQGKSRSALEKIFPQSKIEKGVPDLDDDMKDRLVDGAPSPLLKVLKDKFTELDIGNIEITKLEDKPVAKKIKKKIESSETKLNRIAEGYQEYYESRIKGEGLFFNRSLLKKQTDKDTKTLDDTLKDAALALDRAKALESNANETQKQLNILDKLMDKLDKLLGFDKVNTKEAYDSFYTNRPDLRTIAVDPDVEKQRGLMSRKINNKLLLDRMQTIQRQNNSR